MPAPGEPSRQECRFFAGYPITPSTEIAEEMAAILPREGESLSRWKTK